MMYATGVLGAKLFALSDCYRAHNATASLRCGSYNNTSFGCCPQRGIYFQVLESDGVALLRVQGLVSHHRHVRLALCNGDEVEHVHLHVYHVL